MKFKKILGYFLILVSICIIALPIVTSCSSDPIDGIDSFTIINLIFPNIWVFLATLLATIVLFVSSIWLVWEPFNKKLDARKKMVNSEIEEITKTKNESILEKERIHNEYVEAQSEIKNMLVQANQKANTIHDEIKNSAEQQAHILLKNARQEIEIEKRKMLENINEEILDIAFSAVTEISKQKIDKKENDKLVKEFIESLDKVE
ncbi:MAG: hypothetical protein ACRC4M_00295 [Mycoplasma sp.]